MFRSEIPTLAKNARVGFPRCRYGVLITYVCPALSIPQTRVPLPTLMDANTTVLGI